MKFRKKPVVIDAFQTDKEMFIETLEGTMHAEAGDWIITGVQGERYPCKPDILEKTYEPAEAEEHDQNEQRWIHVSERLPVPLETVLFANEVGVYVGWYNKNYSKFVIADDCLDIDEVKVGDEYQPIFWKPLPKSPEKT